jgi:hypothetical protein
MVFDGDSRSCHIDFANATPMFVDAKLERWKYHPEYIGPPSTVVRLFRLQLEHISRRAAEEEKTREVAQAAINEAGRFTKLDGRRIVSASLGPEDLPINSRWHSTSSETLFSPSDQRIPRAGAGSLYDWNLPTVLSPTAMS